MGDIDLERFLLVRDIYLERFLLVRDMERYCKIPFYEIGHVLPASRKLNLRKHFLNLTSLCPIWKKGSKRQKSDSTELS